MEDEWLPAYESDSDELCYGIPTDARNIPALAQKILDSSYVDTSQGFDMEIFLDFDQLDDELWEEDPESAEYEITSLLEKLRSRVEPLLKEVQRKFGFKSDLSGWEDGYATVVNYTKNKKKFVECIRFLMSQKDLFEYCSLGVSFYLMPVSKLSEDPEFEAVCEEIEKITGGEFSIRGKAELGPYDGIKAGSSFYQTLLLLSPSYEFPIQFFRVHSEDNRLASSYYYYVFSKICKEMDCKLTMLRA